MARLREFFVSWWLCWCCIVHAYHTKQWSGTQPNVNWRATSKKTLSQMKEYIPLPSPFLVRNVASPFDARRFEQRSWQWKALHAGRLTTSRAAAGCGLLEPIAAETLKIPKSLSGHGRAMRAANHLSETEKLALDRFPDLVEEVGGGNDVVDNDVIVDYAPLVTKPSYFPSISAVRMAWGSAQENTAVLLAVDYFAKRGGRVEEVGLCLPKCKGHNKDLLFGASPDGVVYDGDGTQWALEVKCHCPFAPYKGKRGSKVGGRKQFMIRDRLPPTEIMPWVLPQLMLEAFSVGESCAGAILIRLTATKGAAILRVRKDEAYVQEMLKWLRLFNDRYGSGDRHPELNFFSDEPGHSEFVQRTLSLAKDPDLVEVLDFVRPDKVRRGSSEGLFLDRISEKKSSPKYVRLELSKADREDLKNAIDQSEIPKSHLPVFRHVTLMHSSSKEENEAKWLDTCKLTGTQFTVVPHSYVNCEGIVVVGVDILDSEGREVNHIVHSGTPHITGFVPKNYRRKDTGPIFARSSSDEKILLAENLRFSATVVSS